MKDGDQTIQLLQEVCFETTDLLRLCVDNGVMVVLGSVLQEIQRSYSTDLITGWFSLWYYGCFMFSTCLLLCRVCCDKTGLGWHRAFPVGSLWGERSHFMTWVFFFSCQRRQFGSSKISHNMHNMGNTVRSSIILLNLVLEGATL